MYKKTKKTLNNINGIEKTDECIISKPMVFMIMPSLGTAYTANGYLNTMVSFLRFRRKDDINLGFEIEEAPFNIYIDDSIDVIKKSIISVLKEDDLNGCKERIRNFNIYNYCASNTLVKQMFDELHKYLESINYSNEEATEILSQIFSLQVVQNDGANVIDATTMIFHVIQDEENQSWLNARDRFTPEKFSKLFSLRASYLKQLILYDAFGEGTLAKENREHIYKLDYFGAPVLNVIISMYLFESINSSINKTELSIDMFNEDINYLIECAYNYEKTLNKSINDLSRDELNSFNEYMIEKLNNYIIKKYGIIVDVEKAKKNAYNEKILEQTYNINSSVFSYSKYYIEKDLNTMLYLMKYKADDEIEDKYTISFQQNLKVKVSSKVRDIIKYLYKRYFASINELKNKLNNFIYPETASIELIKEIDMYIKQEIDYLDGKLHQKELLDCLNYFDIEMEEEEKKIKIGN